MASAWLLTSGCYSSFGVVGVFSTEANARAYAGPRIDMDSDYGDGVQLEEWPLDPTPAQVVGGDLYDLSVIFSPSKTEVSMRQDSPECIDDRGYSLINVRARDVPHAIKVASERLAELRAHAEGIA